MTLDAIAEPREAEGDADDLWRALADDEAPQPVFLDAWLELLRRRLDADMAFLALGPANTGPYRIRNAKPAGASPPAAVGPAMDRAVGHRRATLKNLKPSQGRAACSVACPLIVNGDLVGVVALVLHLRADLDLRRIVREIDWAAPALFQRLRQNLALEAESGRARAENVLALLATTLGRTDFNVACADAVAALARGLGCDRVSIGFRRGRESRVAAVSFSGGAPRRSELVQRAADAMDEAIDQSATIAWPAAKADPFTISAAHEALSATGRQRAVATAPMPAGDRLVGAIVLERPADAPFDDDALAFIEVAAGILGPVLEERRLNARWLPRKALDSLGGLVRAIFGPRRPALKLALVAAAAALVAAFTLQAPLRVTADARIEGAVRRVIAAPLDGYVQSAAARAGDIVSEGTVMATLDDREIALELRRWSAALGQRQREYETALSLRDRAELGIVAARIAQAEAEIALLEERLARTRLVAPFDGVVLAGDLDQSVGAPVRRGEVLFEIAPLDSYRVILSVDERDLAEIASDLAGELVLTSLPGSSYPIRTGRVTSVAGVEDGRNIFRVEATLTGEAEELRPGMQGVAKIEAAERPIAEIWTRGVVNWLQLALWRWRP